MTQGKRILALIGSGLLMLSLTSCYTYWGGNSFPRIERDLRESGPQIVRLGDTTRVILSVDEIFKLNSTELLPCGLIQLDYLGQMVASCPNSHIEITVHTDNVFNYRRRLKLSTAQANVIAAHLWAQGIAHGRIHFRGCSDFDQVATDHTVFGSADNRRIEVRIMR